VHPAKVTAMTITRIIPGLNFVIFILIPPFFCDLEQALANDTNGKEQFKGLLSPSDYKHSVITLCNRDRYDILNSIGLKTGFL
jgi:hypothetical protein